MGVLRPGAMRVHYSAMLTAAADADAARYPTASRLAGTTITPSRAPQHMRKRYRQYQCLLRRHAIGSLDSAGRMTRILLKRACRSVPLQTSV
jgi:hypothetical protein